MPALKDGLNGRLAGHAPPAPFQSTLNELDGYASGVPAIGSVPESPPNPGVLHGVRSALVVAAPHVCGLASGARGPPFNLSFSSSNGSCGFSLNVAVSCPVCVLAATLPGILMITPSVGSLASRNSLNSLPLLASAASHGGWPSPPQSGSPRSSLPWIGVPSSGGSTEGEGATMTAALSSTATPPPVVAIPSHWTVLLVSSPPSVYWLPFAPAIGWPPRNHW